MVNRLHEPVSMRINEEIQEAFVKERLIHYEIAMANGMVRQLIARKIQSICIKMDISKSYDRVSWHF